MTTNGTPTTEIALADIDLENSPHVRVEENEEALHDYRDAYARNERLPPPLLYRSGGVLLCADGRHRVKAALLAELKTLPCVVVAGTRTECLQGALAANWFHGLRRSSQDKRLCAELALTQWPTFSDRSIAQICGVDHELIGSVRRVLTGEGVLKPSARRKGLDGKMRDLPSTGGSDSLISNADYCSFTSPKPKETSKATDMPAKRDPAAPANLPPTEPVPVPTGFRAENVPMFLEGLAALEEIWQAHPSFHIPAFRQALAKFRVVKESIQLELPGFGAPVLKAKRFKPPTINECRMYAREIELPESEAEGFFHFYQSNGWKVGKNPMVSFQSAMAGWKHRCQESKKGQPDRKRGPGDIALDEAIADAKRTVREIQAEDEAEGHK